MELFDQVRAAPPPDRIKDIKPPNDVENGDKDNDDDDIMKDTRMPSPMSATASPDFTLDKHRNKDKEMAKMKENAIEGGEESEMSDGGEPEGNFKARKRKLSQDSLVGDQLSTDKNKIVIDAGTDTEELDDQPQQLSPPKTKAEQKMFIDHQPESNKISSIKSCRVRIKRLSKKDIALHTKSSGGGGGGSGGNLRKRGRNRKDDQDISDSEAPSPNKKSKTNTKIHVKVPWLQNGSKQRSLLKSNRVHTPPPSKLNKFAKGKNIVKNRRTVSPTLIKRYGKRFFNCVVKIKRFAMPSWPFHNTNTLNNSSSNKNTTPRRSRKSNLSVSFSEAVEIFGSSESGSRRSTLGSGRSPRKGSVSVPTRLQRVDATGNILEDISLTSNATSKRGRRPNRGNKTSESCNGNDGSSAKKLKRSSLRVPVSGLASLRLEDKRNDDDDNDNEDDEYIVPNELPGIHRSGTPIGRPIRKKISSTTTTISDDEDDDDDENEEEEVDKEEEGGEGAKHKNQKEKKKEIKGDKKQKPEKENSKELKTKERRTMEVDEEVENTMEVDEAVEKTMEVDEEVEKTMEEEEEEVKATMEEVKEEEVEVKEEEEEQVEKTTEEKVEMTVKEKELEETLEEEDDVEETKEENKTKEQKAKPIEKKAKQQDKEELKDKRTIKVKKVVEEKNEDDRQKEKGKEDTKKKKEIELTENEDTKEEKNVKEDMEEEETEEQMEVKEEEEEQVEQQEEEKTEEKKKLQMDERSAMDEKIHEDILKEMEEMMEDKTEELETTQLSATSNEEINEKEDNESTKSDTDKNESKDSSQKLMEMEEDASNDGVNNMEPLMVSQMDMTVKEDDDTDGHKDDQPAKDNELKKTITTEISIVKSSSMCFLNSNKPRNSDDILEIETSFDDVRDLHTPLSNNSHCSTPPSNDLIKKTIQQRQPIRPRLDSADSDSSFKSATEVQIAASSIADTLSISDLPAATNTKSIITTSSPTSQLNKSSEDIPIEMSEPQCSSTNSIPTPPFSAIGVLPNLDVLDQLTEPNFQLNNSRHTITTGTLDDIMTALES